MAENRKERERWLKVAEEERMAKMRKGRDSVRSKGEEKGSECRNWCCNITDSPITLAYYLV